VLAIYSVRVYEPGADQSRPYRGCGVCLAGFPSPQPMHFLASAAVRPAGRTRRRAGLSTLPAPSRRSAAPVAPRRSAVHPRALGGSTRDRRFPCGRGRIVTYPPKYKPLRGKVPCPGYERNPGAKTGLEPRVRGGLSKLRGRGLLGTSHRGALGSRVPGIHGLHYQVWASLAGASHGLGAGSKVVLPPRVRRQTVPDPIA
jgi:hypothetical protein